MSGTVIATRTVGLIGYPVEHSLSPAMHNAAFAQLGLAYRYVLLPTPPSELERLVQEYVKAGIAGWNVTVPHKEGMVSLLDEMSDEVRAIGACNTVRVEDGRLRGFNTDIVGFVRGLEEAGGIGADSRAVVLGAGGAGAGWRGRWCGPDTRWLFCRGSRSRRSALAEALGAGVGAGAGSHDAGERVGRSSTARELHARRDVA